MGLSLRDTGLKLRKYQRGFFGFPIMGGKFARTVVIHTSGTAATETVPAGATNVVIEIWGGGEAGANANAGTVK